MGALPPFLVGHYQFSSPLLTVALSGDIISLPGQNRNNRACNVVFRRKKTVGEKVNRAVEDAVSTIEKELKNTVRYINDEVVPTVRTESSRGLRAAAKKLARLADYMDEYKRRR